ncbi:MAG: septum formation initiator family protein [Candidatus Azobacteroides sp.]|nr:septum formation initiator family protein [Candidatus Azobacteroides sp.]
MDKLLKYWKIIRRYTNKYQIVFAVFLIMILFVDEHNVFRRIGYHRKINELKKEIRYYENEKERDKKKLDELQSNDEDLEKFAREEYLMKKDDEDIFIIEKSK